mmetsp:Transcript_30924/g.31211  ORF Transcript_30924/g.31211 Transcript_30924/m.31211 type:complete len:86 (-) Transcript_30924:37-294(-)
MRACFGFTQKKKALGPLFSRICSTICKYCPFCWVVVCRMYRFGVWICLPIGFYHSKKMFCKVRRVETKNGVEKDNHGIYFHNAWL